MKPGKGNRVVFLDRKLYECYSRNNFRHIYIKNLIEDPTLKLETSLHYFCVVWQKKQTIFFIKNEYDKLCSSDPSPPRIYGTPKMSRFSSCDWFSKLHQIVSWIGTFNYNLAHFLCDVHSPLLPNNYLCKDTFSFVSQIKNANIFGKFLVSYDVNSLFTIILLQETIDLAINLIFNQEPKLNITEKAFSFFSTLKTFFFLLHNRIILCFPKGFTIKLMQQPWVILWLLPLLLILWVFRNLGD